MEKNRLQWIDVLKFIGIFAVAFGHIYQQQDVLGWLYTFHVPLFFIAGGIIFKPREILADIKRRAFRILVPYALFGVLMALYFILIESRWRDIDMSAADCFLGLLIGDMPHLEFHSHLWFLPCYFLTTVVYNVLYHLIKPVGCRIFCACCCIVYMLVPIPSLPWGADRALGFLGLFALGELAADKGLPGRADNLKIPVKLAYAAILLGISTALYLLHLTTGVLWAVCAIAGTAGAAMLAMSLEHLNILAAVGRMTLVILCIHGPIYRVLLKLISMVCGTSTDELRLDLLISLAVTAAAIAACCGIYKLLEKLLPWCIGIIPKKKNASAEATHI